MMSDPEDQLCNLVSSDMDETDNEVESTGLDQQLQRSINTYKSKAVNTQSNII